MIPTLTRSVREWASLRCEVPEIPPYAMLRANGHFGSAAKLVVPLGGMPGLRAEVPPFRDNAAWRARAEEELAAFDIKACPAAPSAMEHLGVDAVDRIFAAAGEAGFPPDIRPGGDTCIPLGAGCEARARCLTGRPSLCVTAIGALPERDPCREAVCAFALAVTAELRLVRASLLEGDRLVWEVPLADAFPPVLVDHALNALATVARCAAREIEDLAGHPDLASEWMRIHKTQHES